MLLLYQEEKRAMGLKDGGVRALLCFDPNKPFHNTSDGHSFFNSFACSQS